MTALALRGVVAGYDGTAVVHGVDLTVDAGEVVTLLGANGAGKSTTLRSISGLLPLLAGEIEVLGANVAGETPHRIARRGVGHVTEDRSLFAHLSVAENIRLAARLAPGRSRAAAERVYELFPELDEIRTRTAALLSGGQQQMLAMARAMVHEPRVLLVDEMSLGLAPLVVQRLLPVVRAAADHGAGVLLVEQHVELALDISDRALVMAQGRITIAGTADEVRADALALEASYLGGTSAAAG